MYVRKLEPNEKSETSSILFLEVTQEQKEAIYHFFAHNDWEFKEVQISSNNDQSRDDSGDGDHFIEQDDNFDECLLFLWTMHYKREKQSQLWCETDNQIEHKRNSHLRKEKYKRFWTNLFHRGVWKDPRYLEEKHEALHRDFRREKYIYHRRDLMPKSVIEFVRHWYPNLQDKEYMGHMWE